MTRDALRALDPRGTSLDTTGVRTARVSGDRALAERLVANLVGNAVRHNVAGGWVTVSTAMTDGAARLRVSNSGPKIPPNDVGDLLEPFRRGDGERTRDSGGHGLGLSIVAAIAHAHDAALSVVPRDSGGLNVEVAFPTPVNAV